MPNLAFYGNVNKQRRYSISQSVLGIQLQEGSPAYIWQSKWVEIIAIKTERTQIHFLSDVLIAVASLNLKVPNISETRTETFCQLHSAQSQKELTAHEYRQKIWRQFIYLNTNKNRTQEKENIYTIPVFQTLWVLQTLSLPLKFSLQKDCFQ